MLNIDYFFIEISDQLEDRFGLVAQPQPGEYSIIDVAKEINSIHSFFNNDVRQTFLEFYYKIFNPIFGPNLDEDTLQVINMVCAFNEVLMTYPEQLKNQHLDTIIVLRKQILDQENKEFLRKMMHACIESFVNKEWVWKTLDLENYRTYYKHVDTGLNGVFSNEPDNLHLVTIFVKMFNVLLFKLGERNFIVA